ncbi:MAG: hypothetical protein JWN14_3295 [Chthonomonadales bacterium]|nr:hypothetical protein [Chthonomonadales bacterium]
MTTSTVSQETNLVYPGAIRDGQYFPAILISTIYAWDKNPRKSFGDTELQELADSITADGALQPTHARNLIRFAEFPAVLIAIAENVISRRSPASILESGVPFDSDLYRRGIIRFTGRASFDTKPCLECPHKAYVAGAYHGSGYCLLPAEYDVKENSANAERERKQVQHFEEQVQKSAKLQSRLEDAGVDLKGLVGQPVANKGHQDRTDETQAEKLAKQLPKLESIKGAESLYGKKQPTGCTDDCPCRVLALDYWGKVVEACTDPGRLNSLKGKETRGIKKAARQTLAQDVAELQKVEALPVLDRQPYHSRTLAYLVWHRLIRNAPMEAKRAAVRAWREIDDPQVLQLLTVSPHQMRDVDEVAILDRLSITSLLQLAMEVLAQEELIKTLEMAHASSSTINYLLDRKADAGVPEPEAVCNL